MFQQLFALSFILMCIPVFGTSAAADVKAQAAERGQTNTQVTVLKATKKLSWVDAAKLIDEGDEKAVTAALAEGSIDLNEQNHSTSTYGLTGCNQLVWLMSDLRYKADPANILRRMELLINAGADVEAASANGYTPIMASAMMLSPESIRLLVQHFADPLKKNDHGRGALHVVYNGKLAKSGISNHAERLDIVIKMLVILGLDIHGQDNNELTPVQTALANLRAVTSPLQEKLVEYGASADMSDAVKLHILTKRDSSPASGLRGRHEHYIRKEASEGLARAHTRFQEAMEAQMMRLQNEMRHAFTHAPGYEVLYQDPKGILPIINGYVGRTLFSAAEEPLIAETVEFMERNQAAKGPTAVITAKQ